MPALLQDLVPSLRILSLYLKANGQNSEYRANAQRFLSY